MESSLESKLLSWIKIALLLLILFYRPEQRTLKDEETALNTTVSENKKDVTAALNGVSKS